MIKTIRRKLKPIPRGLIKMYGVIAILLVVIPEWIAEEFVQFRDRGNQNLIPRFSNLKLNLSEKESRKLTFFELRNIAREMKILGYSSDNKAELTKRLRRHLKKRCAEYYISKI